MKRLFTLQTQSIEQSYLTIDDVVTWRHRNGNSIHCTFEEVERRYRSHDTKDYEPLGYRKLQEIYLWLQEKRGIK